MTSSSDTVVVPREPTEAMLDAGQKPHGQDKTGVQRNSVRAAYRAMLAAAPQQSPISGEGASVADLFEVFGQRRDLELSYSYGDEDDDGAWVVHQVNGGINDREWTMVGKGENPAAAIREALGVSAPPVPSVSGAGE